MSKHLIFAILLISIAFFNCNGTKNTAESNQKSKLASGDIILYSEPLDSLKTDYFDIDSIALKDQALSVYVTYSGGCGDVFFEMYYQPQVIAVLPHRNSLFLKLHGNDPCREIVQKKLLYDLSMFNQQAKSGGVVFNLNEFEFIYTLSEE